MEPISVPSARAKLLYLSWHEFSASSAAASAPPAPVASGHYVGILAAGNGALRDRINEVLRQAMEDGRLEAIFRKWKMWNEDQPPLYARLAIRPSWSGGSLNAGVVMFRTGYQADRSLPDTTRYTDLGLDASWRQLFDDSGQATALASVLVAQESQADALTQHLQHPRVVGVLVEQFQAGAAPEPGQ